MKKNLLFMSLLAWGFTFAQSGTLDTSFGTNGYSITNIGPFGTDTNKILIQPDGKILSVGTASTDDTFGRAVALARHNADGTPDNATFLNTMTPAGNGNEAYGVDVALQNDGKIIVAGYCFNGDSHYDLLLMRYNTTGAIDPSFGTGGKSIINVTGLDAPDNVYALTILPDGKIMVVGHTITIESMPMPFVLKFNSNGSVDTSFGTNGVLLIDFSSFYTFPVQAWSPFASNIIILQDGNILVSGRAGIGYSDLAFAKIDTNGNFDAGFGTGGKAIFTGPFFHDKCLTKQPDGKILISAKGTNPENQGPLYHIIVRINSDGSPDTTFGTNGKLFIEPSQMQYSGTIALQPDGKIVAIDNPDPFEDNALILRRYNANGTIDLTFGISGSYAHTFPEAEYPIPQDLKILPDGKILTGMTISTSPDASMALMRFNGGETAGVNEQTINTFSVYPNPTTSIITISNPDNITLDSVSIVDITGKTVLQQTDSTLQIDVQNLSSGMYFLKLTSGNKQYQHKFIKQ